MDGAGFIDGFYVEINAATGAFHQQQPIPSPPSFNEQQPAFYESAPVPLPTLVSVEDALFFDSLSDLTNSGPIRQQPSMLEPFAPLDDATLNQIAAELELAHGISPSFVGGGGGDYFSTMPTQQEMPTVDGFEFIDLCSEVMRDLHRIEADQ
ncbi:hypothetical protein HK101_010351, partial [Irineochytrium annulatum]